MDAKTFFRIIRVEHVPKNVLWFAIGVSIASVASFSPPVLALAFASYLIFWFFAYALNEYSDYEEDKKHPKKCKRPLASGRATLTEVKTLLSILLATSFLLAAFVSLYFVGVITLSAIAVLLYNNKSLNLRKKTYCAGPLLWVMEFSRLLAGSAYLGTLPSDWLLLLGLPTTYIFGFHFYWKDAKRFGEGGMKKSKLALLFVSAFFMAFWFFLRLSFDVVIAAVILGAVAGAGLLYLRNKSFDKQVFYYQYHFLYLVLGGVLIIQLLGR